MGNENPPTEKSESSHLVPLEESVQEFLLTPKDPEVIDATVAIEHMNKLALKISKETANRKFDALIKDRTAELKEEDENRRTVNGHESDPEDEAERHSYEKGKD